MRITKHALKYQGASQGCPYQDTTRRSWPFLSLEISRVPREVHYDPLKYPGEVQFSPLKYPRHPGDWAPIPGSTDISRALPWRHSTWIFVTRTTYASWLRLWWKEKPPFQWKLPDGTVKLIGIYGTLSSLAISDFVDIWIFRFNVVTWPTFPFISLPRLSSNTAY